ncbi:MAG: DUF6498-containing protein [Candidatus Diapherotrites archaeon]|nr:DUF6498-containing protein [Candidatus Diapherotrites archaeon]
MLQNNSGSFGKFFEDPTLVALVLSNIITLVTAIVFNWSLFVVLWIYWLQSIIIGFFNFVRILSLKDFSTEGFTIGKVTPGPSVAVKIGTAIFFAVHFGFFHFIYAMFLGGFSAFFGQMTLMDFFYILFTGVIFFANHLFSFIYHKSENSEKNIGKIMFAPYSRIIPMHLTIIIGLPLSFLFGGKLTIILFLGLKTIADAVMHINEHKLSKTN